VSGGADSMALLWLLGGAPNRPSWAPQVVAAHVHHGLRGANADADEAAARELALRLDVPFRSRRLDGERLRAAPDGSLENVLRKARFAALRDVLRRSRCQALVLAHHRDDLAETFLMRLLRGSGLTGLGAFGPVAEVEGMRVVRPLIAWPHSDLREVARLAGIAWREDASNRDPAFLRNRIRHRVLPYLERATDHAPVAQTLARTARLLEREQRALNAHVDAVYRGARLERRRPRRVGLPRCELLREDAVFAPYLLRRLLADVLEDPYPPSEDRIRELEEFVRAARPESLLQTARNVVVWMSGEGVLWAYAKPRREIPKAQLLRVFRRGLSGRN
jgi:tRNA(Ile)-lysidine synthase